MVAALLLALSPVLTFAQIPTIVPENCRGADAAKLCGVCDIAKTAQNILNAGIYIAIFLSAVLFAYAGWKYMTAGGEGGKSSAKEMLTNVIVGLVILLAAWLIVDTIMKVFVAEDGGFGPWNEIC